MILPNGIRLNLGSAQRFALPACGRSVDNAWEQEKLEARKKLEKPHRTLASSARFVGQPCFDQIMMLDAGKTF